MKMKLSVNAMTLKWKTIVFENLPIKLTQQEERVLRWIVAPKSDKKRARRRSAIWVIVVVAAMLGAIWGLFYVPVVDVSEYESLADTVFTVLAMGIVLGNLYFLFRRIGIQQKIIQKLFAELSSTERTKKRC